MGPPGPMSAGPMPCPYFKGFWIGSSMGCWGSLEFPLTTGSKWDNPPTFRIRNRPYPKNPLTPPNFSGWIDDWWICFFDPQDQPTLISDSSDLALNFLPHPLTLRLWLEIIGNNCNPRFLVQPSWGANDKCKPRKAEDLEVQVRELIPSPKLTANAPENGSRAPKGKRESLPTIHFQGLC